MEEFLLSLITNRAPEGYVFQSTEWWMRQYFFWELIQNFPIFCLMKPRYKGPSILFDYGQEKMIVKPMFIRDLTNCMINDKRFVIIPTSLKDEDFGHANVIIIDKVKKTIQRFEPHGSSMKYYISDDKSFNTQNARLSRKFTNDLKNLFAEILPNYTFEDMEYLGPQHREKLVGWNWKKVGDSWVSSPGYCGAWTLWFIALRLAFPNINIKPLLKRAYRYLDKYGYNDYIEDFGYGLEQRGKGLLEHLDQLEPQERSMYLENLLHT